jgi:hypothetical protein
MPVKRFGSAGGEPAKACQGSSLLVDQAIVPPHVIGREDQEKVIGQRLVSELDEATQAHGGGHLNAFLECLWLHFR